MRTRLIATDLDGTLLDSGLQVRARTRAALDAARTAGIEVVPVTARQPRGLGLIAAQAGFRGWALCGNGAHAIHLGTGETLFEAHVDVEAQRAVAAALNERIGGLLFVSVRERGEVFAAQAGYAELAHFEDHKRHPHEMQALPLDAVLAAPSLKLIVRHPELSPDELLREARALDHPGVAVTHSGAPFIEILAPGVSKAWGLSRLCTHLGVRQDEVLAFGDAPNDSEMLAWAGRGVAMAQAHPDALRAADEVTLGNDEDGVAAVIEALPELSAR